MDPISLGIIGIIAVVGGGAFLENQRIQARRRNARLGLILLALFGLVALIFEVKTGVTAPGIKLATAIISGLGFAMANIIYG